MQITSAGKNSTVSFWVFASGKPETRGDRCDDGNGFQAASALPCGGYAEMRLRHRKRETQSTSAAKPETSRIGVAMRVTLFSPARPRVIEVSAWVNGSMNKVVNLAGADVVHGLH